MRTSKAFPGPYRVGFEDQESNETWEAEQADRVSTGRHPAIPITSNNILLAKVYFSYSDPESDSMASSEEPLLTAALMAAAPELQIALWKLVEICRYKVSPTDTDQPWGFSGHDALVEAVGLLQRLRVQ